MRTLQVLGLLVALLILCAQGMRHIYVAYCEPRTSVLDKYTDTPTTKAIQGTKSLAELDELYAPARKRVEELDKEMKAGRDKITNREVRRDFEETFHEEHSAEYAKASSLASAIEDWEHKNAQVHELHVFWAFGIGLFLVGAIVLAVGQGWLGMALIVPGVVEMLWWTSPSIRLEGCPVEFERLLLHKVIFTLITLAVIIVAWLINERRYRATRRVA
jgi:hypothetical protein